MTAFLISNSGATRFERSDLAQGFSESWLQDLLFRTPDLLPLAQVDPGAGRFIPVCRELPLPSVGGNVFLDLFGMTPSGRPVLVECKLWRNPQARREVIAQILEYAALLRRWTYADLTARLKQKCGWRGENPLYAHVSAQGSALSEADFADAVSRNLRNGDFHLIIAGDGIREDASAIVEHLGGHGARLALVEFQRWRDGAGQELIVPFIPFRTEVVRQRVLVDASGATLRTADEDEAETTDLEQVLDPEKASVKAANRAFWQGFIDKARFDHPDQPKPRHGGNNWVKVPLPSPARWLTVYRYKGRLGMSLVEEPGSGLIDWLTADAAALQAEIGVARLRFHRMDDEHSAAVSIDQPGQGEEDMAWLIDVSNRLVNALRPRLASFRDRA